MGVSIIRKPYKRVSHRGDYGFSPRLTIIEEESESVLLLRNGEDAILLRNEQDSILLNHAS